MTSQTGHYVVVTALRDELPELPRLLRSIESQTLAPRAWVVVDDGSRDGSRRWLEHAAAARPWLKLLDAERPSARYLDDFGRLLREGVAAALPSLPSTPAHGAAPSFVATLDADVDLPPGYFAALARAFAADPSLGVAGPLICDAAGAPLPWQRDDFPWGCAQAIRRRCLDDIGGMPAGPAPDAVANVRALARGWGCAVLAQLRARSTRPPSTRGGALDGYARLGERTWFLGLPAAGVLLRAAGYSLDAPHAKGAAFLAGWLRAVARRAPRCDDAAVRAYYRRERMRELLAAAIGLGRGHGVRR